MLGRAALLLTAVLLVVIHHRRRVQHVRTWADVLNVDHAMLPYLADGTCYDLNILDAPEGS